MCKGLNFQVLSWDCSEKPSRYLCYGNKPLMCVAFGITDGCHLRVPRAYNANSVDYIVKDIYFCWSKLEWERNAGFLAGILGVKEVYFQGVSSPTAHINIGTRAVKTTTSTSSSGDNKWGPIPNVPYKSAAVPATASKKTHSRIWLFPSDNGMWICYVLHSLAAHITSSSNLRFHQSYIQLCFSL